MFTWRHLSGKKVLAKLKQGNTIMGIISSVDTAHILNFSGQLMIGHSSGYVTGNFCATFNMAQTPHRYP